MRFFFCLVSGKPRDPKKTKTKRKGGANSGETKQPTFTLGPLKTVEFFCGEPNWVVFEDTLGVVFIALGVDSDSIIFSHCEFSKTDRHFFRVFGGFLERRMPGPRITGHQRGTRPIEGSPPQKEQGPRRSPNPESSLRTPLKSAHHRAKAYSCWAKKRNTYLLPIHPTTPLTLPPPILGELSYFGIFPT